MSDRLPCFSGPAGEWGWVFPKIENLLILDHNDSNVESTLPCLPKQRMLKRIVLLLEEWGSFLHELDRKQRVRNLPTMGVSRLLSLHRANY